MMMMMIQVVTVRVLQYECVAKFFGVLQDVSVANDHDTTGCCSGAVVCNAWPMDTDNDDAAADMLTDGCNRLYNIAATDCFYPLQARS